MTAKYDHIAATNYLSDLCKDETQLRGRIALLSFRNEISAKRIDTAIMIIEYVQLLAIFLLSLSKIYPVRTINPVELYNVVSVFAKTFSPGNLLPQDKDGLHTVQGVLEFCLVSYFLRIFLFLYIIWLAWKRKTGPRLLLKTWQWVFHLQTKVLFQVFVSIYSNIYEAASKDFFDFDSKQRYGYMAGCVVMSIFEFAFSIVLTTQFTSILPFKRFSASKDNYLEISVLVHKFLVQFLRRLLGLPLNTAKWIYGPMNIIFSVGNIYHVFQKLPVYNFQALKIQINLLVITFTLSVACFANITLDWQKSNMNFVIITWGILTIFCIPLASAFLNKRLWALAFEKGINTKRSPETLVHKMIFIKHIIATNKVPTQDSSKAHISHLIWSTFAQTTGALDFECKESRNKIFMHYLEELMAKFPKNNFIKLYAAYRYARKNKLYGLSIKVLADLKNSNYPTVVTSKSILKNFIKSKTQSDYQTGAYLLNLYDYCKNVGDFSHMKLQMAEQAKLQWALCHEITSVGPDLAEILRLGNKVNSLKYKIHKNFKRMEERMPEFYSKPTLLYAYYNLFMGYSSEDYTKYKEISSKKSLKYTKQFDIDKPIPENLFQENTFVIILSGEKETAGIMNYLSPGLMEIFGRNLIGNYASIITPPFIRPNANLVVKSLTEQNALTFQNTERLNYFYHVKGYMTPINYYLNINPSIYGGLSFIFICRAANQGKEYILLNEEGEIETFTKKIGETLGLLWKDGCYDIEAKMSIRQICPEFALVNQAFNMITATSSLKKMESLGIRKSQITMQPSESPQQMTFEEAKEISHLYSEEGKEITLTSLQKSKSSYSLQYHCIVKTLMVGKKIGKILTLEKINSNQEAVETIEKENNPGLIEEEETIEEDLREDMNSEWINFERLKSEQLPMTTMSPRNLISSSRMRLVSPRKTTETMEKFDFQLTSLNEIPTKVNLQQKKKKAKKDQPHWLKNEKIKISKLYQQALEKPYSYPFFYRIFIMAIYALFLIVFTMYSYMGVNMHSGMSELQVSKNILLKAQQRNNYLGMLDASTRFLWIYATTPASITQFFQGPILNLPTIAALNIYAEGLLETVNKELFQLTTSLNEEQRNNLFEKDIRMYDVNYTSSLDTYVTLTSFQATDRIIEASLKSNNLAFINIQSAVPYLKFVLNNILNDILIKNAEISDDFKRSLEDKKNYFENWITICFSCSLCFLVFIVSGYIYILYLQGKTESNNLFALTKLKPQAIHSLKQDFLTFHNLILEDDPSESFSKIATTSSKQTRQQPIYKKLWPIYYWYFLKVVVLILILMGLFLTNFIIFKRYLNRLSTKASEIYFIEKLSSRLGVIAGSFLEVTAENDSTIIENMQASKALSNQISGLSEMVQSVSAVLGTGASEPNAYAQNMLYGDACSYLVASDLLVELCLWLGNYQEKPGLIVLLTNMELSIKNLYSKFINSDRGPFTLLALQVEAFNLIATPIWLILEIENALLSIELNANFDDIVDHSQSLNITLTIVILVVIVAESLVIHFLIINRLREKETQFKKILGVFPASIVLPNFILKSYITKYSNQTFNSFHHEN